MKRILSLFLLAVTTAIPLCAQAQQPTGEQFNPHWYIQLQGGVGHTIGEADFGKLLSPAAALSAGRQFTPVWALRVGLSGWEAKGAWFTPSQVYKFNFMQVNADVMVDLANWIGGFKYNRTVNPYIFIGIGGNVAFNNDQACALNDAGNKLSLLWENNRFFVAGRAGVGVNFRLCDRLLLGLEVNTNMLPDKFNSKRADNVDWQMNALAGLTFRIGKNYKRSASVMTAPVVMPVRESAPEPVLAEEPAKIEEPVQTETLAVVEAPVEVAVVETPAPVTQKQAPAPPSPDSYKLRKDVFFAINSSVLRDSEHEKIDALVASLKANPKARVSVVGYADAPTGSSIGNYWLSGWRAIRVRDMLKSKGIGASRIDMNFVGDRQQPYSDVEDNRVVICIIK